MMHYRRLVLLFFLYLEVFCFFIIPGIILSLAINYPQTILKKTKTIIKNHSDEIA